MSERFFSNFTTVTYNGKLAKNILLKSKLIKDVLSKKTNFYPYVVKEGERADIIANNYYGDSNYYWLVYMSNDIIDPYYGWPMDTDLLNKHISNLYGSVEQATQQILFYTYDKEFDQNDIELAYRENYIMATYTYNNLSVEDKSYWKPKYAYDFEFENNENKRNILLLSVNYLSQINTEISRVFN
jgi:hypothetical protein